MNIDRIRAAAARLAGHAVMTPLLESPLLNRAAGRRVLVKAECLQRTGSFKFRGGWSALTSLPSEVRQRGVIAVSSGNHAQGVAHAAELLGVPAVIVMPSDAPALKIANTRAHGAEVVLYERATAIRDELGAQLAAERGLTMVKPYDEPEVIAGQGTCGLEIAAQARAAGVTEAEVIVPCGGGGLTSGIALALAAEAPGLRVRTAEPAGFDDTARSLVSGRIERNASATGSICDSILSPSPGDITFPIIAAHCGPGLVVADADCLRAMAAAFLRLKLVIEPGGAAALAAALAQTNRAPDEAVICVASGGNVDAALFQTALDRFGGDCN
jgi:threonine dehydratase